MSTREQDRVQRTMQDTARGNRSGRKLVYHPGTRTIRSVDHTDPDGDTLRLGPSDMDHFGRGGGPLPSGHSERSGPDEEGEDGGPRQEKFGEDDAHSNGGAGAPRDGPLPWSAESGRQRVARGPVATGRAPCSEPHPAPRIMCCADLGDPDEPELEIRLSDMHFDGGADDVVITISAEKLSTRCEGGNGISVRLRRLDDGDGYSDIGADEAPHAVPGRVHIVKRLEGVSVSGLASTEDAVCAVARPAADGAERSGVTWPSKDGWKARGWVRRGGGWQEARVVVVPVREALASRTRGLLETAILADKRVFTAGVGSGAAPIVMELAKLGVSQILMDHDRVEVGNVVRHVADLGDVGRYKVNVMAERARGKNPYSTVETSKEKITWDTEELVADFVGRSDLVVCGVDDHEARVILNNVCVRLNTPLIVAGAFRRAYGGQVLFVKPGLTPCYQCFLHALPEQVRDQEISSEEQAERLAYSDRPVAIEPGLSNDIAPISTMVVKLAIQHLIQGHPTTLSSLDEDLVAPWYLWLNRREKETDYAKLEPLEFNVDGMHVLRWYGIDLERNDACPCCGDFVRLAAQQEGLEVTSEDTAAYATSEEA